jgi:hypothetical protein
VTSFLIVQSSIIYARENRDGPVHAAVKRGSGVGVGEKAMSMTRGAVGSGAVIAGLHGSWNVINGMKHSKGETASEMW